jgi:hypothetical protein
MNKDKVTTFAWGVVAGGIGLSIALFATGWAVRSDTAEREARMMSNQAVADSLAKICVAQFKASSDKSEKLAALLKTDSWQRGNYVNEQGWATMPGSDSADGQVASECAELLAKMNG